MVMWDHGETLSLLEGGGWEVFLVCSIKGGVINHFGQKDLPRSLCEFQSTFVQVGCSVGLTVDINCPIVHTRLECDTITTSARVPDAVLDT
jgi:hypothetical protein